MIKMCGEIVILPDWSVTKLSFWLFPDDTAEEGGEGETEELVSYTITGEVNFTSSKMNRCAARSLWGGGGGGGERWGEGGWGAHPCGRGTCIMNLYRVPTRTGKPGKMGRHFPVSEKSGNFDQTEKVRENHTKYWKTEGISDK